MNGLSVCIIARNEESNILRCLQALKPLQSEIVVVDTGSKDRTAEIARSMTDRVFSCEWHDDFSAARNYAASRAENNLILAVDCDEYLIEADIPALEKAAVKAISGIGMISRLSPYPTAGGVTQTLAERVGRLYDRRHFAYFGTIHETIGLIGQKGRGATPEPLFDNHSEGLLYYDIPLVFHHGGYAKEDVRLKKAERDLHLLQKALEKDGPDPYVYYQIGKCYVVMQDHALAARYFDKMLAMDINPNLAYVQEAVESYGYSLLELKQYEKALGLSGVYEQFARRADFLFLMGLIYMNNAMFPEAIEQFRKATGFSQYAVEGTNSYSAWYNIGVICEVLGRTEEAAEAYEKCGAYAPAGERLKKLKKGTAP